jgi:MerR family mercuric resistance operon transcriptional regulator
VRRKAQEKVDEVRRKIADLRAIERALGNLSATCSGEGPLSDCPILGSLDGPTDKEKKT